jgi:hypothetical protein
MHVHLSALHGFAAALYVLVFLGTAKLIAERYEGHPFADAWARLY